MGANAPTFAEAWLKEFEVRIHVLVLVVVLSVRKLTPIYVIISQNVVATILQGLSNPLSSLRWPYTKRMEHFLRYFLEFLQFYLERNKISPEL